MFRILDEADRPAIMEYLVRNEVETPFFYGNITKCGIRNDKQKRRCADYYGYFAGGELGGVIAFYNLGSCMAHFEAAEALPDLADAMRGKNFDTMVGMQKYLKPLYEAIQDVRPAKDYMDSFYFVNRDFKPFVADGVDFIDIDDRSGDELVEFIVEARVEGFGHNTDIARMRQALIQKDRDEDFIFAVVDGKPVAQGCINAITPHLEQIGGVYTKPDERGKGYCKAAVSELCRRVIAKGKMPALSVIKDNTPAVAAYRALGFETYGDYLIIEL